MLPPSVSQQSQQPVVDEWRAVAAVIALYLVISLLAYPSSVFEYYLSVTLVELLPLGVAWFVCRINREGSWAPGLGLTVTWSGLFLAVLALAAIVILFRSLQSLIPDLAEKTAERAYEEIAATTLAHYPLHIFRALLGGVAEELIFRGFLLSQIFRRTRSLGIALLATSFLFGLVHLGYGLHYVFITGLFGLCFGVVTLLRRNLFPAVLAHVWLNLIAVSVMGARMAGFPEAGEG